METSFIEARKQIIFPEIDYDKIDKIRGMDIKQLPIKNHAYEFKNNF